VQSERQGRENAKAWGIAPGPNETDLSSAEGAGLMSCDSYFAPSELDCFCLSFLGLPRLLHCAPSGLGILRFVENPEDFIARGWFGLKPFVNCPG
jgi:hypothetical protein